MAIPDNIADAIDAKARAGIKSAAEGDRRFENYSIAELIEAERHAASKVAAAQPHFGLRMTKLIPPGGG